MRLFMASINSSLSDPGREAVKKMNRITIETEMPIRQREPANDEEIEQSACVATAIERMEIAVALALRNSRQHVLIRYRNAVRPKPFWAAWLIAQIGLVGSDMHWLAKVGAVVPGAKELILIPRPDKLDVSLARHAHQATTYNEVCDLRLSVVYGPHQVNRTFLFRN